MESVAIRLVVAALVAVPLSRLLLRIGIRQPRVRVLVALVPTIVLATVLVASWSNPQLPMVGQSLDGEGMPVLFGNTYIWFAPVAAQLLLAIWASVVALRVSLRLVRRHRAQAEVRAKADLGGLVPLDVALTADRVAAQLGIPMPPVSVVDDCAGGACVHGIRRPRLLLDRRLVERLDRRELEAVLAHELAHVKRRDNLTALVVALVRDVFFFVPGAAWASRQMHAERELAADQVACATTKRPGALASGLLKVLDLQGADRTVPAAALMPQMPESTLVGRVKLLVNPQELSPARRRTEAGVIVTATVMAVAMGLGMPALVNGAGVRDLLFFYTPGGAPSVGAASSLSPSATAFDVYRANPAQSAVSLDAPVPSVDDDPGDFRPSMQFACRVGASAVCRTASPGPSLGLRVPTSARSSEPLVEHWRAEPVLTTDVFHFYLYRSIDHQRTR